jgi:hypothetical protein
VKYYTIIITKTIRIVKLLTITHSKQSLIFDSLCQHLIEKLSENNRNQYSEENEMNMLFSIMPEFLRNPNEFFKSVQQNKDIKKKNWTFLLVSIFSFMVYGFMVGLAKSPLQAISSAIKLPILFLSTMAFCLPALYFFSLALLGTPLRMLQVVTVVLAGISVTGFLLLGLAPVTLFFVLTSTNYPFFQLLAVGFVGVSSCIGVYFLWRGMTFIETTHDDSLKGLGNRILTFWIVLYAFVGTQMTWRLSPFIGRPDDPFYIIRPSRDNFYIDVMNAIQQTLNISPASPVSSIITGLLCLFAGVVFLFVFKAFGSSKKTTPQQFHEASLPSHASEKATG